MSILHELLFNVEHGKKRESKLTLFTSVLHYRYQFSWSFLYSLSSYFVTNTLYILSLCMSEDYCTDLQLMYTYVYFAVMMYMYIYHH